MKTFTDLEIKVLRALFDSSKGNGHDFGFIEDAREIVGRKQLAGVVSSLVKKDVIKVYDPERTDSGLWTQFVFKGHDDFPRDLTLEALLAR